MTQSVLRRAGGNGARWRRRRPQLLALFSSGPTASGMTVSPATALQVPAVFSCCQVLSARMWRGRRSDSGEQIGAGHLCRRRRPSVVRDSRRRCRIPSMTALSVQARADVAAAALRPRLCGNRARRTAASWRSGRSVASYMTVDRDAQRRKRWTYRPAGRPTPGCSTPSAPPILELTHARRRSCAAATPSARRWRCSNTSARSSRTTRSRPACCRRPARLTTTQPNGCASYWAANYGGSANRGKIPVLDRGLKFKPLQHGDDAAQMSETHEARSTSDLPARSACRPGNWRPDGKRNYSNMESGELVYVTDRRSIRCS